MAGTSKSFNDEDTVVEPAVRQPTSREKKIKAFPFSGGTTIIIRDVDFKQGNIDHPTVTWDYRIDDFTVEVNKSITQEAADYLVNNFPDSFKFV